MPSEGEQQFREASMYLRPRSLDEALDALATTGAQILAGGTDVFPALGDRPQTRPFLDITALPELRGIGLEPDHVRIGATTTWTEIARADLPSGFDALRAAAREVGSLQIQNRGTIAGNLCNASPAADGVPPLLALEAEVELTSRTGRRRLPLREFISGYRRTERREDEIVTAVFVPRAMTDARSAFLKLGARRYLVISIVMVAAMLRTDEAGRIDAARVAVGSCSAVAQRLPALEAALVGRPAAPGIGSAVTAAHLAPLSPLDDVRATGAYRADAAQTLVARALEACVHERAKEAA
jgi:CO/xanthine dehydrogenase FAD-binding subunit